MTPKLSPFVDDQTIAAIADAVEQRRPHGGRDKWLDRLLTWGIAIVVAWGAMQARVAVLEQRVGTQDELMKEMRDDIKTLLRRVP